MFWFTEGPGKPVRFLPIEPAANSQILLIDLHVHLTTILNDYP